MVTTPPLVALAGARFKVLAVIVAPLVVAVVDIAPTVVTSEGFTTAFQAVASQ